MGKMVNDLTDGEDEKEYPRMGKMVNDLTDGIQTTLEPL